ncbi:MAG: DUF2520 domain-containing protein [Flavobacteriaceae bacterium]|jgi:predicted short-subunit dehydrogenase-like oxidoreductase (DUF2520 family)|nr:DUF2520 domain-containing protein [Flavobacteriaceae bacterium]
MIKVVVLGSGNVATHLIRTFLKNEKVNLIQVYARNPENLKQILPEDKITKNISNLAEADVYIIAVSDNAIKDVSNQIQFKNRLVVHTSGSMNINTLNPKNRRGVFYPLQTFSISKEVNFKQIPICLETENATDYNILEQLAHNISENSYNVDSEKRKALHVAAVFVSNFVNHLYALGEKICVENNLPFQILKPLIIETANKITYLNPKNAQTGPAKRNDTQTTQEHLNFIKDEKLKNIYQILTESIQNHVKKL